MKKGKSGKLQVSRETLMDLRWVSGGEDLQLPPTELVCDPLKAERVE